MNSCVQFKVDEGEWKKRCLCTEAESLWENSRFGVLEMQLCSFFSFSVLLLLFSVVRMANEAPHHGVVGTFRCEFSTSHGVRGAEGRGDAGPLHMVICIEYCTKSRKSVVHRSPAVAIAQVGSQRFAQISNFLLHLLFAISCPNLTRLEQFRFHFFFPRRRIESCRCSDFYGHLTHTSCAGCRLPHTPKTKPDVAELKCNANAM